MDGMRLLMIVVCSCSLVLSVGLVLTYALFKRRAPHSAVLAFAASALLLSCSILLGPIVGFDALAAPDSTVCLVQGFLIQIFGFAAICYYFCICLSLFLMVELKDLRIERRSVRLSFQLSHFSLVAALGTALASLLTGEIAFRDLWCWISADPPYMEMAFFYGPMFFFAVVAAFLWIRILFVLSRSQGRDAFKALLRHLVFCGVFIVLFSVMFAHRLYNVVSGGKDLVGLEYMHVLALGGVGIWITFIFGFSAHNWALWRRALCSSNEEEIN
jgi:hypothetical protein